MSEWHPSSLGYWIEVGERDGPVGRHYPFSAHVQPRPDPSEAVSVRQVEGGGYRVTLPADPEPLSDDQVFDFKVEGIPIVGIIEDPKGGNMEITGPGPVSTRRVRLVDATWQDKRTISCDQIEIADDT